MKSPRLKKPPKRNIVINKSKINARSFTDILVPSGTQTLILDDNFISDFIGLEQTNDLKKLSLINNPILSFTGFPSTPELESINLDNTPISGLRNFRALCLIVAGPQLQRINGIAINRNDRNAANSYGPSEAVLPLLIRGWLPVRPVSVRDMKNTKDYTQFIEKIQMQENDPISLKATRVLRTIGYTKSQIKSFVRHYFEPDGSSNQITNKYQNVSPQDAQVERQQDIINVLAAQMQALKCGNHLFTRYNDMILKYGKVLIENTQILGNMNENEYENTFIKTKKVDPEVEYHELRNAVINLLSANENIDDDELIENLNQLLEEEEEEQIEDDNDYNNIEEKTEIEIDNNNTTIQDANDDMIKDNNPSIDNNNQKQEEEEENIEQKETGINDHREEEQQMSQKEEEDNQSHISKDKETENNEQEIEQIENNQPDENGNAKQNDTSEEEEVTNENREDEDIEKENNLQEEEENDNGNQSNKEDDNKSIEQKDSENDNNNQYKDEQNDFEANEEEQKAEQVQIENK